MTVFAAAVTGATGYVGSLVAAALRDRVGAEQVLCVGRRPDRLAILRQRGFPVLAADVRDRPAQRDIAAACRAVVHCAALLGTAPLADAMAANADAPVRLLAAATEAGVARFVQISSIEVYGEFRNREIVETSRPCGRLGPYGASKLAGDRALLAAARRGGPAITVVRLGAVYGPFSPYWVHRFVRRARAGTLRTLAGGSGVIYPVYERDAARFIARSALDPAGAGPTVFNLVNDEQISWQRWVSAFLEFAGRDRADDRSRLQAEIRALGRRLRGERDPRRSIRVECRRGTVPCGPARALFGEPLTRYEDGLARALDAVRATPRLVEGTGPPLEDVLR